MVFFKHGMTFISLVAMLLIGSIASGISETGFNNGEDVTRPLIRTDTRLKYQEGVNDIFGKAIILTLRTDQLIYLPNQWQLSFRADIPYEGYTCSHTNSCGESLRHFADSLFQTFLISQPYGKWRWAIGTKMIFPTGGKNLQIGDGKYQLLPSFAFRRDLDGWLSGAYIGAIFRHAFAVAGYKSAPSINQTYIQPFFNINLPDQWFLNFSPELIYNWRTNQWFIPFDMMLGKLITSRMIISLEYDNAIVYDFPQYKQQVEFRFGYFY